MNNSIAAPIPHHVLAREVETPLAQMRNNLNARYRDLFITTTRSVDPVTIWSSVIPRNASWIVQLTVSAFTVNALGNDTANFYERSVRIKRGAVAPTTVRTTTPIADDEDEPLWSAGVSVAVDGTVSLVLIGDAALAVQWVAWVEIQEAPRRRE